MTAYYNEIDPYAAQWLRNLIKAGHIADGEVDQRSIIDVSPDDLKGFTQCHFFAGIGVWSHALRRAGWPDDREVWTGSCPCQPFSVAGVGRGIDDERHLWPFWFHLIEQRKPQTVFGEQVDAAIRYGWLDLVQADMEGSGYAFAPVGIPAAGIGAPHIRQRLWFVAEGMADHNSLRQQPSAIGELYDKESDIKSCSLTDKLADTASNGREWKSTCPEVEERREQGQRIDRKLSGGLEGCSLFNPQQTDSERLADTICKGSQGRLSGGEDSQREAQHGHVGCRSSDMPTGEDHHFWSDADWLGCKDGNWRPVEPGSQPLVDGASARMGRLRAYGNAIVAPVAEEIIKAHMHVVRS